MPWGNDPVAPAPTQPQAVAETGEEYMKKYVSPDMQPIVRSIVEGRSQYPSGFLMKTPQGFALIKHAQHYDPTFDASIYPQRAALRKDYEGGGKQFQELNAISTVAGHLHKFMNVADELNNRSVPWWNEIANTTLKAIGDPRVDRFNTVKQGVTNELSRAYRGGHVTEGDVKEWQNNINSAQSPEQLKSVIGTLNDLLMSKRTALEEAYKYGMGSTARLPSQFSSVNERTRKLFDDVAAWSQGAQPEGQQQPAAAPAMQQGASAGPRRTSTGIQWSIGP